MLNWPLCLSVAAIIVGIAALFILRPALIRLLDRTKRVSKEGAVFEQDREVPVIPTEPAFSSSAILSGPVSASVLDREKIILKHVREMKAASEDERIRAVIRTFAATRLDLEFCDIGNAIFGSQLRLLVVLSSGGHAASISSAKNLFTDAAAQFPAIYKERSFDTWLGYLKSVRLIEIVGETLIITQYGSDFLKYLIDTKRAHERSG